MFPNFNSPEKLTLPKPDIHNNPLFVSMTQEEEVRIVGGVPQKTLSDEIIHKN